MFLKIKSGASGSNHESNSMLSPSENALRKSKSGHSPNNKSEMDVERGNSPQSQYKTRTNPRLNLFASSEFDKNNLDSFRQDSEDYNEEIQRVGKNRANSGRPLLTPKNHATNPEGRRRLKSGVDDGSYSNMTADRKKSA